LTAARTSKSPSSALIATSVSSEQGRASDPDGSSAPDRGSVISGEPEPIIVTAHSLASAGGDSSFVDGAFVIEDDGCLYLRDVNGAMVFAVLPNGWQRRDGALVDGAMTVRLGDGRRSPNLFRRPNGARIARYAPPVNETVNGIEGMINGDVILTKIT